MVLANEKPTMAEAIRRLIESKLANLHTTLPGRVESYDAATQKADIQPLIKGRTTEGESYDLPILPSVPVKWPRTASAIISLPLAAGDTGTIIFHERSLDQWLLKGGVTDPLDDRKHSYSDAEFIPGLYPFTQPGFAEDTNILIKNALAEMRLTPTGKFSLSNGANELLDLIDQLLDECKKTSDQCALITVNTVVGTSTPPNNAALFTLISTTLTAIKALLATLKV
jgi:hypothetical protein